jgi:CubicO group peptidase (beta-lactamase class C family)
MTPMACLVHAAAALAVATASAVHATDLAYRPIPGASPEPLAATGPTTRAELESFVDGLMEMQLATKPTVGAVISVVKDGKLFFAKGYGHADYASRAPVDAERTLFRPGSVGKLFTWTAVMQQVEQGKLDLDADVNTYLADFKLPATHRDPVTLRNLMTHTGGFEDIGLGVLAAHTDSDYQPLNRFLGAHIPLRARPPTRDFGSGANAAYSNWGTALAGHIVERVSGLSFDDYVEEKICRPLGMNSTTFREPLPAALAPRVSQGYQYEDGAFELKPFERFHNIAPAGSGTASATDMAKFMLAYLGEGANEAGRILRPETVRQMHTRTLSPAAAMHGMGLGFFEFWVNGRRVLWHGGDTGVFHTDLALVPEANLGLFISVNTGGAAASLPREVQRAFLKHYFPARLPPVELRADADERNARYAGAYRDKRRSYALLEKAFAAGGELEVEAMPDGTLLMEEDFFHDQRLMRWAEVGDGLFRAVDQDLFVVFESDAGGQVTDLVGPFAIGAHERLAWYDQSTLHAWLLALAGMLCLTTGVSAVRRRAADRAAPRGLRWARPVLALAGALLALTLVGLVILVSGDPIELLGPLPPTFHVVLTLPLLAIAGIGAAVAWTVLAWRDGAWTLAARLHYTAATAAALVALAIFDYWNLLGYHFG